MDVLFPVSVFQSFKPVPRGGVRKQVAKTDSQRFSIFFANCFDFMTLNEIKTNNSFKEKCSEKI